MCVLQSEPAFRSQSHRCRNSLLAARVDSETPVIVVIVVIIIQDAPVRKSILLTRSHHFTWTPCCCQERAVKGTCQRARGGARAEDYPHNGVVQRLRMLRPVTRLQSSNVPPQGPSLTPSCRRTGDRSDRRLRLNLRKLSEAPFSLSWALRLAMIRIVFRSRRWMLRILDSRRLRKRSERRHCGRQAIVAGAAETAFHLSSEAPPKPRACQRASHVACLPLPCFTRRQVRSPSAT